MLRLDFQPWDFGASPRFVQPNSYAQLDHPMNYPKPIFGYATLPQCRLHETAIFWGLGGEAHLHPGLGYDDGGLGVGLSNRRHTKKMQTLQFQEGAWGQNCEVPSPDTDCVGLVLEHCCLMGPCWGHAVQDLLEQWLMVQRTLMFESRGKVRVVKYHCSQKAAWDHEENNKTWILHASFCISHWWTNIAMENHHS